MTLNPRLAQYRRSPPTSTVRAEMAEELGASQRPPNSALKDVHLKYRACTLGYAESLRLKSPSQLVGQTDFDLLSERGARLVREAERRVLEQGTADVMSGNSIGKQTAGKYFVRSPVVNHTGQVCGIEVFIVGAEELHDSYRILLGAEQQFRAIAEHAPVGLLVHRNSELIYFNQSWLQLTGAVGQAPSPASIRELVTLTSESENLSQSIRSANAKAGLRFQARSIQWDGDAAQVVYCTRDVDSEISRVDNFIEKRSGHRRSIDTDQIDHTFSQLSRLEGYVSSAADFTWEMDQEQRLTEFSVEMKEFFGVASSNLLHQTLDALVDRYVQEDDVAEWKVLMADLKKHLPFRDREYRLQSEDGKRVVRLSGVPVFDSNDQFIGYRGIGRDYTAQHHSASIVEFHASHDSLTGLVNRREFELRCDEAIQRAATAHQALCFIDLDNFKRVNDTAGHLAGDELLRQLAKLFTGLVRKSDVLARLGGDEFGLLIYEVGLEEALRLTTQLRSEVESFRFHWEGKQFSIGASIGLVLINERWETRSALFGAADAACYEAKRLGRNRVAVYDEETTAESGRRAASENDEFIKNAINEKRIRLAHQRITTPESPQSESSMLEILMRLPSEDDELLLPGSVLPQVERYGLSIKLDKVVIEAAVDWLERQPHVTDRLTLCCINISKASLDDDGFKQWIFDQLDSSSLDKSIICFEISELAISTNLTAVASFMEKMGELGCQFAMDDFSGGIDSFSYLKKLPVNFVKINSEFVKAILEDTVHYAMVKSINDVAQTLGKKTIAESVESEAVLAKLRELGVNYVQGFYVSPPELIDF